MNFEEWIKLGEISKKTYRVLLDEMKNHHRPSKIRKWFEIALDANIKMRDKLDDIVFELFPEKKTQELASVFFGEYTEIATNPEPEFTNRDDPNGV